MKNKYIMDVKPVEVAEYDDKIKEVYFNEDYGFSTDKWMSIGYDKVYNIITDMKNDESICLWEFLDFIDYMKEEGIL